MPLLAEVPDNVVVPLVVRLALVFSSSAVPEPVVPLIAKLPAPELDNTLAPALNQTPSLDVEVPLMVRLPAVFDTVLVPRKLVPAPSVEMPDKVMSPDVVRLAPELKFIPLQVALPVQ